MDLTKKKTTRCQGNHPMLSRSYASKEKFLRDYKKFYGKLSKAKEFYLVILTELENAISEDKIGTLTKLNNLIDYMNNIINHEVLRNYYDDISNPIRSTNLIILASKHNKVKILEYLFDNDNAVLNNLTGGIGRTSILPVNKDEANHNAFYYAIRSENIQLLGVLIDKWPGNYFVDHLEELEEVLSKSYEDLKLKNVLLSNEMEVFVERKLIDLRFFSTALQDPSPNTVDFNKIKERIELVRQCICMLNENYSNAKKVDDKFLYIAKFIARNVHILKGRLRSTYDRIPWEEMEFCLIIFVSSQTAIEELNLFYRANLNKKKILKYLVDFAEALGDRENIKDGDKLHHVPRGQTREENVKNIIGTHPQFEQLYNDYHQIRDKYSLKRISDHIQLAVSVDAEEKQGQFVIIRVLQVIGEHLKNSLESPKLSHTAGKLLELLLSQNSRKIITDLRDEISHSDLLLKIMETDGKADVNFFNNIQNDVRKVGDVITDIFYENRIKTIRILFKKVAESETPEEMKDVLKELSTVDVHKINIDNWKPIKYEKLVKLIEELSDNMTDRTNYENRLFNKIHSIINSSKNVTKYVRFDYIKEYAYLRTLGVELNFRNHIDENYFKNVKLKAKMKLNNITAKIKVMEFEEIAWLSSQIFDSFNLRIHKNKISETWTILTKIILFVEYEKGDIKWIEEFREKIPKQEKKRKGTKQNDETKRTFNQMQFEQKVNELKSILTKNSLEDIKNNEQVQSVVKLFVLNLMSILGGQEDYLQNNILFLDDNTPLLHGKCLRNYLAHDNVLVDLLLSDPLNAVILNAEKFTKTNIMESTTKIGKLVSDDPAQLKKKLHQDLDTITNQEKMFVAVEEGDLDGLKDYLQKGADVKARSTVNSWTTLHFAAKGSSLDVIRYILDQNLSVNVKDNIGQTPLHIAVTHGRQNIVNFFFKQTDVRVDVLNNRDETPLHVAAEYGHKDIVEILLNNKANIYAQDRTSSLPLHYAIRNNFIDVAKILLKKDLKFDINEILCNGMTALHLAAIDGNLELFNFLVKNGSEINARDNRNRVPLHYAAQNSHLEVVIALILKGANVNARDIDGKMPLHHAIYNGNIDLINCLLTNGAYVNTANITPLHIASLFGRLEIVTTLLKRGADIHAECDINCTPLHYAAVGEMYAIRVSWQW